MPKIYCADQSCEFNGEDGKCKAKSVALSWHSVVTMNDGRQEYQRCKTRQPSERYLAIQKAFEKLRKAQEE